MTQETLTDAQIAEAAFYLWHAEGQPEGRADDHWLRAKASLEAAQAEVKSAAPRKRATAKPKAAAAGTKAKTARKAAAPKTRKAAQSAG